MPNLLSFLLISLLAFACHSQSEKMAGHAADRGALADSIEMLTQQLLQKEAAAQLDGVTATRLIELSRNFADAYPTDSLAPVLLFRAADVARGIGEYEEAVAMWGQVSQAFPLHPRAENALFLQGFITDQHLNKPEAAKAYYQQFLAKYPDSAIAGDVRSLLSLLESQKSPEDLIKEFEKKNSEQNR